MARGPYHKRVQPADAAAPPVDAEAAQRAATTRALYAAKRALKVLQARKEGPDALRAFIELCMPDPEHPDDPDKSLFQCEPHHRILIELVAEVESKRTMRAACSMPPQHGKEISHTTQVLTTDGWKTHGDLRLGDEVFGPDGKPARVVALTAGSQASLRVEFTDGEAIDAHPDHEWTVYSRARGGWVTLDTKTLASRGLYVGEPGKRGSRASYQVHALARLEMPARDLPIHPYLLGAWLGDGSTKAPGITHHPDDLGVLAMFEKCGYRATRIAVHPTTGVWSTFFAGKFHADLRDAGLLGRKHVPAEYLLGSVEQRLQLLAGFIDTDGYVYQKTRRVCLSNTDRGLIDSLADVIRSLGWRATIAEFAPCMSSSGIQGKKTVYQLTFSPDLAIPTQLARKAIPGWNAERRMRGIRSITPIEPTPSRCIQVDRPDGLYLVGRQLVPTHNSLILSRFGLAWIIGRNPHLRVLFATYADGLAQTRGEEVREVLQSATFKDCFPRAGLKRGSQSKTEMVLVAGGTINFVGRGTATTGRPADLFVIDDPYSGEDEGSSAAIREQVKNWYSGTVFSRCHVLTPILVVHTRWQEDDLLGWQTDPEHPDNKADPSKILGADGKPRWKYVNLPTPVDDPALAKVLGVAVGSPLWPARFPLHHLAEAERNNPRIYAALYRGRPAPEDGDFFRAEHIVTYMPSERPPLDQLRLYAASDHAVSEKQRADSTVMGVVGVDADDTIWILPDLFWKQAPTDVVVEAMIDMLKRHNPLWWRASSDHISKSIGPFLRRRMLERRVFGNVVEGPEQGDKVKKAQAIQGRMAMKKVRFPAGAPWLMAARHELLKFPHAKHDDFVDFLSHIGRGLRSAFGGSDKPTLVVNNGAPAVGTLGWIKWAAKRESAAADLQRRMGSL